MTIQLDTYISELLYDYDCVILPQLGGFVTNYKPAYFSEGVAHPATKELRFNKNLSKNDGLLSQTISNRNNISIQEADALLHETIENYLGNLKQKGRIELKKVGVLFIDKNEQLRFSPDKSINYLRGSFGFESFELPPIVQVAAQESVLASEQTLQQEYHEEDDDVVIPISDDNSQNGIYWVAAATLLPFVAMSLYLGMTTDFKSPTELNVADLFPSSQAASSYTERSKSPSFEEIESETTNFPKNTAVFPFDFELNKVDSLGVWVNLNELPKEVVADEGITISGLYHIIGGCFGEKENAFTFVKRLKTRGYNAGVLDIHKGLYRVKVESFHDYGEALKNLRQTRDSGTFPNAWLLKKKVS